MKKLSKRIYELLRYAVSTEGSFDPNKILYLIEEDMTAKEVEAIEKFLNWVNEDVDNRCFGSGNYAVRFEEYLKSTK